jgi:hypothetical protein
MRSLYWTYPRQSWYVAIRRFARRNHVSERTVKRWIEKAHDELTREARFCKEEGCPERLPLGATKRRDYCDAHQTSAAKVRRHREGKRAAEAAEAQPAKRG